MASYFDADDEVLSIDENENEIEEYKHKPTKKTTNLKSTIHLDNSDEEEDDDDDIDEDDQYGGADDDYDGLEIAPTTKKLPKAPNSYEDDEEIDEGDGDGDEDDDDELNDDDLDEEKELKIQQKIKQLPQNMMSNENSDDEDDDEDNEHYLKKFDKEINKNYIMAYHPECIRHNYDEIEALTKVVRDSNNIVIDKLHRTIPYITKYERTRILGQRAKQINAGATPFVKVPENVIDGYLVAELELLQKRIPFIIQRPLPNGGCEYWNVKDLENISF